MRELQEAIATSAGKECDGPARVFPRRLAAIEAARSNERDVVPAEFLSRHRKKSPNKTQSSVGTAEPVSRPGFQST